MLKIIIEKETISNKLFPITSKMYKLRKYKEFSNENNLKSKTAKLFIQKK